MGIFDRIRKIFSSSDSSTTRNNRFDHEPQIRDVHGLTTEFNHEVRPNRDFNVSSNATERPLASALCHSSTTSVATQTSNTSQIQPDTSKDNIGSVKPSEFGQNSKHKTSSTLISAVSENGEHISTVEAHASSTSTTTPKRNIGTARSSLIVPTLTSHKPQSTTFPDHRRLPKYYKPISSSNEPTVPRTVHTYTGVNDVVEPPSIRKSLPKTQANLRSSFSHVVKGKHIFSYTNKIFL